MNIASFRDRGGASYGALSETGIIDLGRRLEARYPTLRRVLDAGALGEVSALAAELDADLDAADVTFLPVIPDPDKIVCSGVNYKLHIEESQVGVPDHPILFTRLANTLVGHGEPLIRPSASERFRLGG